MTGLRPALACYLDLRRGLGFKLDRDEKLLDQFITYLEQRGTSTITVTDALAWATLPASGSPGWLRMRITVVRGFAAYLATLDPSAEVPPASLLPGGTHRAVPYLYSAADIAALFTQAGRLKTPLRRATITTLIGLLAVTGMRRGEAIALDDADFDPGRGLLTVRHAKLGRHRLLPLHPTTVTALQDYRLLRGQRFPRPVSDALLVSTAGTRLLHYNVGLTFTTLARRAGLAARPGGCRPRPHDLRHSFAVATLLDWYRDGGDIAATMQAFFTERLIAQRRASPHTIAAYRDTLRLVVRFAAARTGTSPCHLDIADLDAPVIAAFLDHLERERGNTIRSRNARLAAIHSLFGYAALRHPEHAADIARVLAIPPKRGDQTIITFLTDAEAEALLAAPDRATRTGRRDHAWILLAIQTGLRASELTALTCRDIHLGAGAYVACHGKGRKDRITPLAPGTVTTLRAWLAERAGTPDDPLFTTIRGGPMSRDALQQRLTLYVTVAGRTCPALASKNVTPHVLRHSAAMALLHAGVDITVIALWLGHESVTTTQIYLQADMALKQQALDRTKPPATAPGRYKPPDQLLAFLEAL